jgi:hypothetical protein
VLPNPLQVPVFTFDYHTSFCDGYPRRYSSIFHCNFLKVFVLIREIMDASAEKGFGDGVREKPLGSTGLTDGESDTRTLGDNVEVLETAGSDHLHRKLTGTQVQLFAIVRLPYSTISKQRSSRPNLLNLGWSYWHLVVCANGICFAQEWPCWPIHWFCSLVYGDLGC